MVEKKRPVSGEGNAVQVESAGYHTPSAIQTPEEARYSNLMRKVREQGY